MKMTIDETLQYFIDMYSNVMYGLKNKNEVKGLIQKAQSAQTSLAKREAMKDLIGVPLDTIQPPNERQQMNNQLAGAR